MPGAVTWSTCFTDGPIARESLIRERGRWASNAGVSTPYSKKYYSDASWETKKIAFDCLAVGDCINLYPLSETLFREERGLGLKVGAVSGAEMN